MRGKGLDEELAKTISTRDTGSEVEGGRRRRGKCERVTDEMNKKNRKWDNERTCENERKVGMGKWLMIVKEDAKMGKGNVKKYKGKEEWGEGGGVGGME
jgi:hypothetical protein